MFRFNFEIIEIWNPLERKSKIQKKVQYRHSESHGLRNYPFFNNSNKKSRYCNYPRKWYIWCAWMWKEKLHRVTGTQLLIKMSSKAHFQIIVHFVFFFVVFVFFETQKILDFAFEDIDAIFQYISIYFKCPRSFLMWFSQRVFSLIWGRHRIRRLFTHIAIMIICRYYFVHSLMKWSEKYVDKISQNRNTYIYIYIYIQSKEISMSWYVIFKFTNPINSCRFSLLKRIRQSITTNNWNFRYWYEWIHDAHNPFILADTHFVIWLYLMSHKVSFQLDQKSKSSLLDEKTHMPKYCHHSWWNREIHKKTVVSRFQLAIVWITQQAVSSLKNYFSN